ncbi:hypothetical protein D2C78_00995 [Helicobacter pylori]|nr:hypothetical protein D2C78_00995 [Helicobacter pylori]
MSSPLFYNPPLTPSYCKFSLKCPEYSGLRLSLGEKILEGREILKNALILANSRQQFALWHL